MIYIQKPTEPGSDVRIIVPLAKHFEQSSLYSTILDGGDSVSVYGGTADGGNAFTETYQNYAHGGYAYMGAEYLNATLYHKMSGKSYSWENLEPIRYEEGFYFIFKLHFDDVPKRGEYLFKVYSGEDVVWDGILKMTEDVRKDVDFNNGLVIKIYER